MSIEDYFVGATVVDTFLGLTAVVTEVTTRDRGPCIAIMYEKAPERPLDFDTHGVLPLSSRLLSVLAAGVCYVPIDGVSTKRFFQVDTRSFAAPGHVIVVEDASEATALPFDTDGLASRMVAPWTVDVGRLVQRYQLLPGTVADLDTGAGEEEATTKTTKKTMTPCIVLGVDPADGISIIVMMAETGRAVSLGAGSRLTVVQRFADRNLPARYHPALPRLRQIDLTTLPVNADVIAAEPCAPDATRPDQTTLENLTSELNFFDVDVSSNRTPSNRVQVNSETAEETLPLGRVRPPPTETPNVVFRYQPSPPTASPLDCRKWFHADVLEYGTADAPATSDDTSSGGAPLRIAVDMDPDRCREHFDGQIVPGSVLLVDDRALLLIVVGLAPGHRIRGTQGKVELVVMPQGARSVRYLAPDVEVHGHVATDESISQYKIVSGDSELAAVLDCVVVSDDASGMGGVQPTEDGAERTMMLYQATAGTPDEIDATSAAAKGGAATYNFRANGGGLTKAAKAFYDAFETPEDITAPCQIEALAVVRRRQTDMDQAELRRRMTALYRACEAVIMKADDTTDEKPSPQRTRRVVAAVVDFVRRESPLMSWFSPSKTVDSSIDFSALLPRHSWLANLSNHVASAILQDTHFRNLFEVLHGNGCTDTGERGGWEENMFRKHYHASSDCFDRPKYGVLNIFNDPRGQNACEGSYGDCYLVFRSSPEFRRRVTLTATDSSDLEQSVSDLSFGVPILLGETETTTIAKVALQALGQVATLPSTSSDYREIQVHGRVCLHRHVTTLVVGDSYWNNGNSDKLLLLALAAKHGWWVVPVQAMRLMAVERLSSQKRLTKLIELFSLPVSRQNGGAESAAAPRADLRSRIVHPSGPLYLLAGPQGRSHRDLYDEFCHRVCRYFMSMPLNVHARFK